MLITAEKLCRGDFALMSLAKQGKVVFCMFVKFSFASRSSSFDLHFDPFRNIQGNSSLLCQCLPWDQGELKVFE